MMRWAFSPESDLGSASVFGPASVFGSAGDPVARLFEAIGEEQLPAVAYVNTAIMADGVHLASLPMLGATALMVGDAVMNLKSVKLLPIKSEE